MRASRVGLSIAALLVVALSPLLMAPSGGFPFQPIFGRATVGPPTSGNALKVMGANNANAAVVIGGATVGQSFGSEVDAGSNASDWALNVCNQAGTTCWFRVDGTGAISGRGATAAAFVDMTPDTGTATLTITGCTTSPTGTLTWSRVGKLVVALIPIINCTSNSTSYTLTGLPAAVQPTTLDQVVNVPADVVTSGIAPAGLHNDISMTVTHASGTLTMNEAGSAIGWNAGGLGKGTVAAFTTSWLLN